MTLEEFIAATLIADDEDTLLSAFKGFLAAQGMEGFGFGAVRGHALYGFGGPVVRFEYPKEWVDHYGREGYVDADPTIRAAGAKAGWYGWGDVPVHGEKERRIMGEAREAGLVDGVGVAIHGGRGEMWVFGVAAPVPLARLPSWTKEVVGLSCIHFQQAFLKVAGCTADLPDGASLTARERESLQWAAAGLNSWETGEKMRISQSTVDAHVKNAMAKLGAATRVAAVAKAFRMGLLVCW